ncbi:MAG TPA: ATP-binding protein [Candidatus Cryptobacteroides intestinipullorum]|nr:ATP-binding protein [Candidatus Cryptobacteroides intestinipullorum]
MKEYKPRIADQILEDKLQAMGAVLIEGPKYCGKTTLGMQHAKSVLSMSDPDTKDQNMALAQTNISRLLQGDTPRLIDEWQIAPQFWDAVRNEVDKRGEDAQFILTGSAVPPDTDQIYHTGTGRMAWLKLRTMSLWESGDSSGDVSLGELFKPDIEVDGHNDIDLDRLAFLTCRGGWPKAVLSKRPGSALTQAEEYFETVVRFDISRADGIARDEEIARRLMRSYARNQGSQATAGTILADIKMSEGGTINENTVYSYIKALKKIFVIEDAMAWNPNLRSKTAVRTSDTRYFTDPSISAAALGLGPEDLINDMKTFGFIFESLCIRDLRIYAEALKGKVYHYRDKNNLECDAVVHLRNGKYGLVEIKIGGHDLIEEGAANLVGLSRKIDTSKMNPPSFLMVMTGVGNYAYRRPQDNVLVVPAGCLKD